MPCGGMGADTRKSIANVNREFDHPKASLLPALMGRRIVTQRMTQPNTNHDFLHLNVRSEFDFLGFLFISRLFGAVVPVGIGKMRLDGKSAKVMAGKVYVCC